MHLGDFGVVAMPPLVLVTTAWRVPWVADEGVGLQIWRLKLKIKSVAYSSQGSHTGQLDFCN